MVDRFLLSGQSLSCAYTWLWLQVQWQTCVLLSPLSAFIEISWVVWMQNSFISTCCYSREVLIRGGVGCAPELWDEVCVFTEPVPLGCTFHKRISLLIWFSPSGKTEWLAGTGIECLPSPRENDSPRIPLWSMSRNIPGISNWWLSSSSAGIRKGFFSDLFWENFGELLEVNLNVVSISL